MTTSHATTADWSTYIGTTPPANVAVLLRRASLDVDQALISAVYDTTDVDNVAALAEATCEQASALLASGSVDGNPSPYSSVSAGSISLTRATRSSSGGGSTGNGTELSPRAFTILQLAGLTGYAPSTGWE